MKLGIDIVSDVICPWCFIGKRRFEKALTLPAAAGSEKSAEIVLGIDKRWKQDALGVAAFLQDPATLAIEGAAARELGAR